MQEDPTTLQEDSQKYLITGAAVLLTGSSWILLKWLKSKTQLLIERLRENAPVVEALEISEGSSQFIFKAVSFSEEKSWRKPKKRNCPEMEIEIYRSKDVEKEYYQLSERETSVSVDVEPDKSIQIRFRYKNGELWTTWSEIMKMDVPRPAYQLTDLLDNQGNLEQPDNSQEFNERDHFNRLCAGLKEQIQGRGEVQIHAPEGIQVQAPDEVQIQDLLEVQIQAPHEVQIQALDEVQIQAHDKVIIRLMGRTGIGKSSFINTAFCAMTGRWRMRAVSYGASDSVTRDVRKYELVPNKIWLGDMPGFQHNSNFELVKDVFAGCYDNGAPIVMDQVLQNDDERANLLMQSRVHQKTAVVLVLSVEKLEEGVDEVNKEIIEQLMELNEPCIAVVTKVDKFRARGDEAITEENFFTDPRVQACCNKLLSLGVHSVFPLMNYSGNTNPHYKIDYAILKILTKAIELANR